MTTDTYHYERIAKAIEFITDNITAQPSLEEVAEKVNLSPFHFQRIFTEWAGVSPKKFLQFLTADYLKAKIKDTATLIEAAEIAGLSSQSRVYDLFTGIEAVTPQEFKSGGKGLHIDYAYHDTPFGECFMAVTERGICGMAFTNEISKDEDLATFKQKWHFATIEENPSVTEQYVQRIFTPHLSSLDKLHLLVQGTNFQLKVWEALLTIPQGSLTTYQQIADSIGHNKAVRAVGTAVGNNPIAYLIPCHRVIRKEGKLGEYHWGTIRKKAIVGWEASKIE
ncbi:MULTISPECIES: methylated-DNA--[protein]-cysteine S-methyltransferase [unclassified Arcicella]|uniref:bifunctional helix-turn-helix domain-containing protein/methylated-DNA--[protein]-cysteine S-methyltransferase n=1 Tax=unclassified Arcicella TaxID=2644986 RepID=UPI00286333AB|nr:MULTISPECIES: methylated-DNA--[protein]-cysteine S-methyltransferase [unclassified Arcicella]MDR6564422.1 AraC family transcriptional regulator of adaptative response/methylated-DNA-[protein]-cysteine methyltransferase [Arcicella sp. BE51]MDR6814281.1 AraC family transcriptional regulator of adaptative response/methylated-DNA-[protein]-cysteine methyltransferase [Arcicella sp. BE140]MDR6825697.1 AraC family transcriptional regulator of adaptative response/methylated-DNA-[protein]-cysteine met